MLWVYDYRIIKKNDRDTTCSMRTAGSLYFYYFLFFYSFGIFFFWRPLENDCSSKENSFLVLESDLLSLSLSIWITTHVALSLEITTEGRPHES